MTKKLYLTGLTVFCALLIGSSDCSAGSEIIEQYTGLTVAASRGLRIAAATGNIMMVIDAFNRLGCWDKFFMTPQRSLEPSELRQEANRADSRKYKHIWLSSSVLLKLQCLGLLMRDEDDGGSLSLAVEFLAQSAHGLIILYTANRMVCDLMERWYVRPQRVLMGKECLVCYEENRDNTLIAPCGNRRHHICVTCYPRLVGAAQHYECLLCRCKVPRQEVRLDSVAIYEKVNQLSYENRRRIGGLLLVQCAVLVCLYLSFRTLLQDGHPGIRDIDVLIFPMITLMGVRWQ